MSHKVMSVDTSVEGASEIEAYPSDASIADASVAHALNSTFSDTEVEAALNALGAKINAILDVLDNAGLTL